jgi:hypothetical protein
LMAEYDDNAAWGVPMRVLDLKRKAPWEPEQVIDVASDSDVTSEHEP